MDSERISLEGRAVTVVYFGGKVECGSKWVQVGIERGTRFLISISQKLIAKDYFRDTLPFGLQDVKCRDVFFASPIFVMGKFTQN